MKKITSYQTSDGKTFNRRLEARHHETDIIRLQRVTEYFQHHLPQRDGMAGEPSVESFIAAILVDPVEFTDRLSARAARRANPTIGLVGRKSDGPRRATRRSGPST
jgi:hypothetical protein